MKWNQAHWSEQALIVSLCLLLGQSSGSIAGVTVVALPALVLQGMAVVSFLLVLISQPVKRVQFPLEPFLVTTCAFFLLAYGSVISPKTNSIIEDDLATGFLGILLIPIFLYLRQTKLLSLLEIGIAMTMTGIATVAAAFGFLKLTIDSGGGQAPFVHFTGLYPQGTSLVNDYNMAALMILIGVFGAVFLAIRSKNAVIRLILWSVSGIVSLIPLATQSRRYMIFFFVALVAVVLVLIWTNIFHNKGRSPFLRGLVFVIAAVLLVIPSTLALVVTGVIKELPDGGGGAIVNSSLQRLQTLGNIRDAVQSSRGDDLQRGLSILNRSSSTDILLGQGFGYMDEVGLSPEPDHPHSPILTSLLYGGVFSLLAVLTFILRPLWFYFVNIKSHPFLASSYGVALFFLLVSGNSYASVLHLVFFATIGYSLSSKVLKNSDTQPKQTLNMVSYLD